jgi:hypothetical protein
MLLRETGLTGPVEQQGRPQDITAVQEQISLTGALLQETAITGAAIPQEVSVQAGAPIEHHPQEVQLTEVRVEVPHPEVLATEVREEVVHPGVLATGARAEAVDPEVPDSGVLAVVPEVQEVSGVQEGAQDLRVVAGPLAAEAVEEGAIKIQQIIFQ